MKRWMLTATILGSAMAILDGTVVNIALPVMKAALHATAADAQWIVDAYLVTLTSLLLAGGALGDQLGRTRLYSTGVILFAAASAWCGVATSVHQLIAARAVQGLGGALLVPGSLAIITAIFPASERGRAIGTWSAMTSLSVIGGPILGGWLVQAISWRAIFFLNLPVAAVTLLIVWRHAPPAPGVRRAVDWGGTLLVTSALASLTWGLIEKRLLVLPFSLAAFLAFVFVERKSSSPIMPLPLFRSRTFSAANALTLFLYAGLAVMTYLLPFYLIGTLHYSPAGAGAALLPFVITMSLLSRWTGALADRIGPRLLLITGPLLAAVGLLILSTGWIFAGVLTMGIGMAITVAPLTTAVMTSAGDDDKHAGAASGINNTVARAAALVAIAIFGADPSAFHTGMLAAAILAAAGAVSGAFVERGKPHRASAAH